MIEDFLIRYNTIITFLCGIFWGMILMKFYRDIKDDT